MAVSLQKLGQQTPAVGFLSGDGFITLIEGETRLRGARVAGLDNLRIELRPRPESDKDLYEAARAANVERNDQTPIDDAIRWGELLEKNIYPSQRALGEALGYKEDVVSRILSLAKFPTQIVHALSEYPQFLNLKMLNAFREYWEQQGDEPTIELIHESAKSGFGYRDVTQRRKAAQQGPVSRIRALKEQVIYNGAKGEIKSFEKNGRLALEFNGLSGEDMQQLKSKLKSIFNHEII